jgi:hypothetical protein
MKMYWGSGGIASSILDLGIGWRWVVSFTPQPFYPQEKSPRYTLDRRLGGPQSRSGHSGGEEKNSQPLSGIEPRSWRSDVISRQLGELIGYPDWGTGERSSVCAQEGQRILSSPPLCPDRLSGPPGLLCNGYGDPYPVDKAAGTWSYISISQYVFMAWRFTFTTQSDRPEFWKQITSGTERPRGTWLRTGATASLCLRSLNILCKTAIQSNGRS